MRSNLYSSTAAMGSPSCRNAPFPGQLVGRACSARLSLSVVAPREPQSSCPCPATKSHRPCESRNEEEPRSGRRYRAQCDVPFVRDRGAEDTVVIFQGVGTRPKRKRYGRKECRFW